MNLQNKIYKQLLFVFLSVSLTAFMAACVKTDIDEPEIYEIPIGESITIAELRDMFEFEPIKFENNETLYAVVTMDGSSGNIYRSAYIADETGALNLRITSPGGLYQGDFIRINLSGTILSSYRNMLQLDSVDVDNNIVKLETLVDFEPIQADIADIVSNPTNYQGQLVKLENVQFLRRENGQTFADKENLITVNRMLENCAGDTIIVRTSGYAGFANHLVPTENGSLIAIVSQFDNTAQLLIRDINEVVFDNERCAFQDDFLEQMTIKEVRELFDAGTTDLPVGKKIQAVVISDRQNGNYDARSIVLMDESQRGIAVSFEDEHDFNLGDLVRVNLSNLSMNRVNGLLQINAVPNELATFLIDEELPAPTVLTVEEALAGIDIYESTLVRINAATITGGTNFASPGFHGNRTLTDATGDIALYTLHWSVLASEPIPSGANDVTAILTIRDNPRLMLRSISDIQ